MIYYYSSSKVEVIEYVLMQNNIHDSVWRVVTYRTSEITNDPILLLIYACKHIDVFRKREQGEREEGREME